MLNFLSICFLCIMLVICWFVDLVLIMFKFIIWMSNIMGICDKIEK